MTDRDVKKRGILYNSDALTLAPWQVVDIVRVTCSHVPKHSVTRKNEMKLLFAVLLVVTGILNPRKVESVLDFQNLYCHHFSCEDSFLPCVQDSVSHVKGNFLLNHIPIQKSPYFGQNIGNEGRGISPFDCFSVNSLSRCSCHPGSVRSGCISAGSRCSLNLRGGGKEKPKSKSGRASKAKPSKADEGNSALVPETKSARSDDKALLRTALRGSRERSAMLSELAAGAGVEDQSKARLSIQRVEQLRRALARKDKDAVAKALNNVRNKS